MLPVQKPLPAILFAVLVLAVVAENHAATPVRDKVLEEVQVMENDDRIVIEVHFSFPLRYRSHFPQQSGRELQIRLFPVRIPSSDWNAAYRREAVVPRYAETAALDEVIYDGEREGGPYLTLHFTRPVTYQVIPGADYRSMNIVMQ